MDRLQQRLQQVFGFTEFRLGQREAIEAVLRGERLLLIQPTGWGKSLVYQMVALEVGLTLVFSPLRALMRDQVRHANERFGIQADTINSDISEEEQRAVLERAVSGNLQLLYIAPERLENTLWQEYLPRLPIKAVVVDEAHCVSVWGHDFRPEYRRIVNLLKLLPPDTPALAVTATATKRVEEDIRRQFGDTLKILRGNLLRPNFRLFVQRVSGDKEKLLWTLYLIQHLEGTGLVYCATRAMTEIVSQFLQNAGIDAPYYHAGLGETRVELEQQFVEGRVKALVGTNALGMGIDKPDVRFVIHTEFPSSPLHYYQEIGRAGRDGEEARIVLLYDPDDRRIQENFIESNRPRRQAYQQVIACLMNAPMREKEILLETGFQQSQVRTILNDLLDAGCVVRDSEKYYRLTANTQFDLAHYESLNTAKYAELDAIIAYAESSQCRMQYLRHYLGDEDAETCGLCDNCRGRGLNPYSRAFERKWGNFKFRPPLIFTATYQKAPVYAGGVSLNYYNSAPEGSAVRHAKYEGGERIPDWLIEECAQVIREQFPVGDINGLVPIPSTKTEGLVDDFTFRLARLLQKPMLSMLTKTRETKPQKDCMNYTQKRENLKGAFECAVQLGGQNLLVVDDVYDTGVTLEEAGKILKKAGAGTLYAFCIVRTRFRGDV